jgi:hypothetical protein
MTTKELLQLVEPAIANASTFRELCNIEQPKEWIKTKKSISNETEYEFNEVELLENLCNKVFDDWHYEIIFSPVICQDKNGVSVTQTVKLFYTSGSKQYTQTGTATEYVNSMKLLSLATPKCSTMAFKNACRKIGKLFGGGLNRGTEEADLPTIVIEKEAPDRAEQRYKLLIDDCNSVDELRTYQFVIPKSLKEHYEEKFKTLNAK